jgi:hypothetical protein
MERKVLTPFEGLKAIDGDIVGYDPFKFRCLQEQAMTAQARDLVRDRGGATQKCPGHLAIAHAPNHHHDDAGSEIGALLPVGCREGLGTEVTLARETCKPLDTVGASLAKEEALALERPVPRQRVEVGAVGIGAMGRNPSR